MAIDKKELWVGWTRDAMSRYSIPDEIEDVDEQKSTTWPRWRSATPTRCSTSSRTGSAPGRVAVVRGGAGRRNPRTPGATIESGLGAERLSLRIPTYYEE